MKKKKSVEKISYNRILLGDDAAIEETEAFETIRTNLLYFSTEEDCPVYAVTSAAALSGKSAVLANLALSFTKMGKKVLIMDLNLRNPVQHRIFRVQNTRGAGEVLAGLEKNMTRAIARTAYENLYLMTAGKIPPNPAELLADGLFQRLLAQAKQWFDCIFLDLPSVGEAADALIVAEQVTGYVYVVRAELDEKPALSESLQRMKASDARVLGIVLNGVAPAGSV